MTFEQKIAEVRAAGFVVNNLFQIDQATKWQCNLMTLDAKRFADYGIDEDPVAAIDKALRKMKHESKDSLDVPDFLKRAPAAEVDILS